MDRITTTTTSSSSDNEDYGEEENSVAAAHQYGRRRRQEGEESKDDDDVSPFVASITHLPPSLADRLLSEVEREHWKVLRVPADGNCFLHALVMALFEIGIEASVSNLRGVLAARITPGNFEYLRDLYEKDYFNTHFSETDRMFGIQALIYQDRGQLLARYNACHTCAELRQLVMEPLHFFTFSDANYILETMNINLIAVNSDFGSHRAPPWQRDLLFLLAGGEDVIHGESMVMTVLFSREFNHFDLIVNTLDHQARGICAFSQLPQLLSDAYLKNINGWME